ncbi:ComEC/Rec2 family competence protein [Flavobacterium sp. KACC 22763]|uniref:ComEC/Rec2 family competence protein n=1 Tax=Flavobacterium sp. KACC 22763 TaxID=3025668 RepID=UPI002365D33B|nr:MBL fold metallo-hydrolase [Flavobacterium sp. KACC 22763]WDF66117.1 MBL fold metallo-hydrolase [Flavobacterium sp. KACC 22763]
MKNVFNVNALPATFGDCLLVEYGDDKKLNRILIDGGTGGTKASIKKIFNLLPEDEKELELLVVTHIDQDHIEGILSILEEKALPFKIKSIWYNGYLHLPSDDTESFGPAQGERLTAAILRHSLKWNTEFNEKAVVVPDNGELPVVILGGGMKLTLLSPTNEKLRLLRPVWEKELEDNGLKAGFGYNMEDEGEADDTEKFGKGFFNIEELAANPFKEDSREGNGSSIAFKAEYCGKSVLFCADAHPSVLIESLDKLGKEVHEFDLVKVSHHGSHSNTGPDFLKKISSARFLVSTNGSRYKHPHAEAIAQIIVSDKNHKEIIFNYKTEFNSMWDSKILKDKHNYKAIYSENGCNSLTELFPND